MKKKVLAIFAASVALGGCANLNSISRMNAAPEVGEGSVFTVDSKQRHLIMSRVDYSRLRVCAEAAPDVFSAFATSLAARGDNASAQLSLGASETAATIERTQTINLLRESFYRTCERYLSGAISETQFITQAARDQRSMVAILAIEQLTGVARGEATIIAPGGTAASVMSGEQAADLIREYDHRLETAKAEQAQAEQALQDAADSVCSDAEGEDSEADPEECTALSATAEGAKRQAEEAQEALDNVMAIARDLVTVGSASTSSGVNAQGGGTSSSDAKAGVVAAAVVQIVALSSIDEPLMFCLAHLTEPTSTRISSSEAVTEGCMQILIARANADLQTRSGQGFDQDVIEAFADGVDRATASGQFFAAFDEAISAIPEDELRNRVRAFEQAVEPFARIAPNCSSRLACSRAARLAWDGELGLVGRPDAFRSGLAVLRYEGEQE